MQIMLNQEGIMELIMLIGLIGWLIYCVFYICKNQLWQEIIDKNKCIYKVSWQYTLDLLTKYFLIVDWGEKILYIVFKREFKIGMFFERMPTDLTEWYVAVATCVFVIYGIMRWVNKVLELVNGYIVSIEIAHEFVKMTVRVITFIIYLIVYVIVLLPMFAYGFEGLF